jgi:trafficking protein particle complex subunit 13
MDLQNNVIIANIGTEYTVDKRLARYVHVFVCVCTSSERTMDLMLILKNNISSGVLWTGISNKQLGKLEPCASTTLHLSIVAVRTGLLVS